MQVSYNESAQMTAVLVLKIYSPQTLNKHSVLLWKNPSVLLLFAAYCDTFIVKVSDISSSLKHALVNRHTHAKRLKHTTQTFTFEHKHTHSLAPSAGTLENM